MEYLFANIELCQAYTIESYVLYKIF